MNQRITKLVRQVLKECVSTPVESVIASRIDDHGIVEIPNTFAEKFAELIVRECIDVVKPTPDHEVWPQSYLGGVDGLELLEDKVKKINRHFGVEE